MITQFNTRNFTHRQTGAALVVSLILLSLLTVLAMSASQTTRMQERMAGNARDTDLAFQAAEAGVRRAERYIADLTAQPNAGSAATSMVYQKGIMPTDLSNKPEAFWSDATTGYGKVYGTSGVDLAGVVEDPRYIIEEAAFIKDDLTEGSGPPTGKVFYRTTARAKGGTDTAIAVVQTTYTRRF
jgi:type IV pilus assembly protein PilX